MTQEQVIDFNSYEDRIELTIQKETSVKRWLTTGEPETMIESKVIEYYRKTVTIGEGKTLIVTDNTPPSRATIDPNTGLLSYTTN